MNPYRVFVTRLPGSIRRLTPPRWHVTLRRNGDLVGARTHLLRSRALRTASALGAKYGTVPR